MKVMEADELSMKISEALREVEQGEAIEVMRRGEVVSAPSTPAPR